MQKFDVDYFIAKFEAIPDEKWCTQELQSDDGQCCVLGHCGESNYGGRTEAGNALRRLFRDADKHPPYIINDMVIGGYSQPTPRARILAALYDIKEKYASQAPT